MKSISRMLGFAFAIVFTLFFAANAYSVRLTAAFTFICDPQGNSAGGAWDTRYPSDFYKIFVSSGPPGGSPGTPNGLNAAFINGPGWPQTPININLTEGTHKFTMFFQAAASPSHIGLNLFFDDSSTAQICAKGPIRDINQGVPEFSANSASSTYSMSSFPNPNAPASGCTWVKLGQMGVELAEYYVAKAEFFSEDRVGTHSASPNCSLDYVGTFTLVVSGPPPSCPMAPCPPQLPAPGNWVGYCGVEGGIPPRDLPAEVYNNTEIQPPSGQADSAFAINDAITNCFLQISQNKRVVKLAAGTFYLDSPILLNKSGVTLRGSPEVHPDGTPKTTLHFRETWKSEYSGACIYIRSAGWNIGSATAQYNHWNHRKVICPAPGSLRGVADFYLDSDPTDPMSDPPPGQNNDPEPLADGQLLFISSAGPRGGGWSDWFSEDAHDVRTWVQCVRVGFPDGNWVSFQPPINADYLTGTTKVHWKPKSHSVYLSGIENLNLEQDPPVPGHEYISGFVRWEGADSCWAKNIKSTRTGKNTSHHSLYVSYRCEIRHCEMSDFDSFESNNYCIAPLHAHQLLVEDNYFHHCPNVMPLNGVGGSAFAYNYIDDLPYSDNPLLADWLSQIVYFHGAHNHYNLFEGNWCAKSNNDRGCGSQNNVWLRNRMRGWDSNPSPNGKARATHVFGMDVGHTKMALMGNVLGEVGYHNAVLAPFCGTESNPANCIYNFHVNANETASLLKNYNTFNGVPQAEINAFEAVFGNVPVPTSYLHASKPTWFRSLDWPWCKPDDYPYSNEPAHLPAGYRATHNGQEPP